MSDETLVKLDSLLPKIPPELLPLVEQYGPTLLKMGQDELFAWAERLMAGDFEAAYRTILERMDNPEALLEGERLVNAWKEANTREAERRAFFKSIALDALKVLLAILAAAVAL